MLHRGIKFIHVAVLAFSAALAFLFVRGLDEKEVLGNSAVVWVFGSDDSMTAVQVNQAIASFTAEHDGVAVAREVPDMRDPDGHRHLYLAANPKSDAAAWLDNGYPEFSKSFKTDVHPISDLGQHDPRGFYDVFGSPAVADALMAKFTGLGLQSSVSHPLAYSELSSEYKGGALYWSFWVVALAAITMTGASVLLRAKAYGVLRLQGVSLVGLLLRDLRQLAVFWSMTAGAVVAVTLAFLGFYNDLAWFGLFTEVALVLAGLLTLLALAAHAGALALTFKVSPLRALKGELPFRAASASVYLVRVPALLLALSIAMNVAHANQDVLARQHSREAYVQAGDAVTIRLNGSLPSESEAIVKHVGSWLRQADRAGQVIVAGRRDLQNIAPEGHLPTGEVLIVNETFLAKQVILDPSGRRYKPAVPDGKAPEAHPVRLIIPESLTEHASTISSAVLGVLQSDSMQRIRVTPSQSKNHQRLFAYNPGNQVYSANHSPDEDRSLVRDPIVVVVPNGSKYLTDGTYTSFASQEGVIFPEPADVTTALQGTRGNKLPTYVTAVRPIAENSALKMRDAVRDLRMQLFNLVIAVIVLLICGVGVCIIYSRKNAQVIFVHHISGWRYTATHRFILAVEAAIAILLATRVPFEAWLQNQKWEEYVATGAPAPFSPVRIGGLDISIIAGLVTVEFGAMLLALAVFHNRIVKEGATEA
ncbi:hypothetical protein [Streptomyces mirabilis]|uniref:hypothetical protein n=1 Tax=Streptomyces mirabilis TaxID=68239 RepID=UPI0035DE83BD